MTKIQYTLAQQEALNTIRHNQSQQDFTNCMRKKPFAGPLLTTTVASSLLLAACGGGGGGSQTNIEPVVASEETQQELQGAAIKGPIINGVVKMYLLDPLDPNLGVGPEPIAEGTTDSQARMQGLVLPDDILMREDINNIFFLVEVTGGTSLTTGGDPVVETLRTLIKGIRYQRDQPVYATPLSTLALDLYALSEKSTIDGAINPVLLEAEIIAAANKVKVAFGLGLIDDPLIDVFSTAPIIEDGSSTVQTERALRYRTASETFAATVVSIQDELTVNGVPRSASEVITLIAEDLIDGTVDAENAIGGPIDALSTLANVAASISLDPATLNVPGTGVNGVAAIPISEINQLLVDESGDLLDEPVADSMVPAEPDPSPALGGLSDRDNDGVADGNDAFPDNGQETIDSDGDGVGDNSDFDPNDPDIQTECDDPNASPEVLIDCGLDADADGVSDADDLFPNNPDEAADSDGDCPASETSDPGRLAVDAGTGCGDNADISYCYTSANATITTGQTTGDFVSTGTAVLEVYTGRLSIDQPQALAETFAGGGVFLATSAILDTVYEFFLYDPDILTVDTVPADDTTGGQSFSNTVACAETGSALLFTTCGTFDLGVPGPVAPIISAAADANGGEIVTIGTSGSGAVTLASTITLTPLPGDDGEIGSDESCNFPQP